MSLNGTTNCSALNASLTDTVLDVAQPREREEIFMSASFCARRNFQPIVDRFPWSSIPTTTCTRSHAVTSSINRYYDPATDQFLSIDPDVQQTDQPYVFTNDDPLNATDPLGLCHGFFGCIGSAADDVGHFVVRHSNGILQTVEITGALACAFASAGMAAGVCFVAVASSFTTGVGAAVIQSYNPKTGSEDYVALGANVAIEGLSAIGPPNTSQPLRAILGVINVGVVLEHSVVTEKPKTTTKKKAK
jgi:hypothetical protein